MIEGVDLPVLVLGVIAIIGVPLGLTYLAFQEWLIEKEADKE